MKKTNMLYKVLLTSALSVCVTSASAANPNAVLKVTGTLTNAACTPALSNGGTVDYGTIKLGDLSDNTVNQLGQKNIDLTINCTAATKVSWSLVDDRSDSKALLTVENATFNGGSQSGITSLYGVGKTAGGVNIGNYAMFVKLDNVTADGASADIIGTDFAMQPGNSWVQIPGGFTQGETRLDITVAATGTQEPLAFQNATFPLVTSLAIQDTTTLAITDDTKIDGQLTISMRYL